jgi:AraC family transcriptional regulator
MAGEIDNMHEPFNTAQRTDEPRPADAAEGCTELAFARGLAAWQIRRAQDLMRQETSEAVSIAQVAAACKLSRGHFSKAFKESTGVSPYQWLMRHRIERAKNLLTGTRQSIAQVAVECGFADQSHFTRAFRQAVGEAPGVWRRTAQYCLRAA